MTNLVASSASSYLFCLDTYTVFKIKLN